MRIRIRKGGIERKTKTRNPAQNLLQPSLLPFQPKPRGPALGPTPLSPWPSRPAPAAQPFLPRARQSARFASQPGPHPARPLSPAFGSAQLSQRPRVVTPSHPAAQRSTAHGPLQLAPTPARASSFRDADKTGPPDRHSNRTRAQPALACVRSRLLPRSVSDSAAPLVSSAFPAAPRNSCRDSRS